MAMFHARKGEPPPPEVCHRCHGRMGTSYVHFVRGPDDPLVRGKREAWLCDPCRAEVQRESGDN
jgi:hypothetical protein